MSNEGERILRKGRLSEVYTHADSCYRNQFSHLQLPFVFFFSKDGLPQKPRKGYPSSSLPISPFTATMTYRAPVSRIKILPLTFMNRIMLKNTSGMPKNGKIPHVDVGAVSLDHYIHFTDGRHK